jgi:hypothetical protein
MPALVRVGSIVAAGSRVHPESHWALAGAAKQDAAANVMAKDHQRAAWERTRCSEMECNRISPGDRSYGKDVVHGHSNALYAVAKRTKSASSTKASWFRSAGQNSSW